MECSHPNQGSVELGIGRSYLPIDEGDASIKGHAERTNVGAVADNPQVGLANGYLRSLTRGGPAQRDRDISLLIRVQLGRLKVVSPGERLTTEPGVEYPVL